jgi:hypothetical protein
MGGRLLGIHLVSVWSVMVPAQNGGIMTRPRHVMMISSTEEYASRQRNGELYLKDEQFRVSHSMLEDPTLSRIAHAGSDHGNEPRSR